MGQLGLFKYLEMTYRKEEWACSLLLLLKGDPEPKGTNFKMTDFSSTPGKMRTITNFLFKKR